jgi:hypothetical protein
MLLRPLHLPIRATVLWRLHRHIGRRSVSSTRRP